MIVEIASIGSVFDRAIVDTGRLPEFLFLIALVGTFAFIRTSTHMIRAQVSWWPGNVSVGGTHVHHLVWGILAMMIVGYVGVVVQPGSPWHEITTVVFAFGVGLTLDEFALWLELKDVYWEKDGRKSVHAMVIAACVAGLVLVGFSAWLDVAADVEDTVIDLIGFFGSVGIAVAIVNAAKQKYKMALIGLIFWPAAVATAVRLGHPHSPWARLFYRGRRLELAEQRYGVAGAPDVPPAATPGSAPAS